MIEANLILTVVIRLAAWFALIIAACGYSSNAARVPRPEILTKRYLILAWYLDWWFFTWLCFAPLGFCVLAFLSKEWFIGILLTISHVFLGTVAADLLPKNRRQIEHRPDLKSGALLDGLTTDEKFFLGNSVIPATVSLAAVATLTSLHFDWKWYAAVIVFVSTYVGALVWVSAIAIWIGLKLRPRQRQSFTQDLAKIAE